MILINSEFSVLDANTGTARQDYKVGDQIKASIYFDIDKNHTTIEGDLYNLIGYADTIEERDKFKQYVGTQKWMAEQLILKLREKNKRID